MESWWSMSWIPRSRKRFLERQTFYHAASYRGMSEADVIRQNVDWLIGRCYEPDEAIGAYVSDYWLNQLGLLDLRKDAINWGDLSCSEVRPYADGSWEILIEEAAPDASALCAYIREWMTKWGWRITVRTEW